MFDLILSAIGIALHAVFEAVLNVLPASAEKRKLRATRRRVREMGKTDDWAGIEREFNDAMAAGTSSRLPSVVIDEIPQHGAGQLAHVIARGLRVADPLTLMPAARLAPQTNDPQVYNELVALRDSGDQRLMAVAEYALKRWPEKSFS